MADHSCWPLSSNSRSVLHEPSEYRNRTETRRWGRVVVVSLSICAALAAVSAVSSGPQSVAVSGTGEWIVLGAASTGPLRYAYALWRIGARII